MFFPFGGHVGFFPKGQVGGYVFEILAMFVYVANG